MSACPSTDLDPDDLRNCQGLGVIEVYDNGRFTRQTCRPCQGIGHLCSGCGKNPATCGCDREDKSLPPRQRSY